MLNKHSLIAAGYTDQMVIRGDASVLYTKPIYPGRLDVKVWEYADTFQVEFQVGIYGMSVILDGTNTAEDIEEIARHGWNALKSFQLTSRTAMRNQDD